MAAAAILELIVLEIAPFDPSLSGLKATRLSPQQAHFKMNHSCGSGNIGTKHRENEDENAGVETSGVDLNEIALSD